MDNTLCGEVLNDYVSYATGERIKMDNNHRITRHVQFVMKNFASGEIKEKIITRVLGYEQNTDNIHGCDAFNNGRPVEIKTETVSFKPDGSVNPLAGNAAWGSTNYEDKLKKLVEENQELVLAGFSPYGKLGYIISCNLNDTTIAECIMETLRRTKANTSRKATNVTPKTTHAQLGKFEVKYLHRSLVQLALPSGMKVSAIGNPEQAPDMYRFDMRGPFLDKIREMCQTKKPLTYEEKPATIAA